MDHPRQSWYVKNLGDALLASDSLEQIKEQLLLAYVRAGKPKEMAAFVRHESEGRLHCEVCIYFSPAFESEAKNLQAAPCVRPAAVGLSLLIGNDDVRRDLFPGFSLQQ